jgi:hypothetical protein
MIAKDVVVVAVVVVHVTEQHSVRVHVTGSTAATATVCTLGGSGIDHTQANRRGRIAAGQIVVEHAATVRTLAASSAVAAAKVSRDILNRRHVIVEHLAQLGIEVNREVHAAVPV